MSISWRAKKSNGINGQCTESAADTKQVRIDNDNYSDDHDHYGDGDDDDDDLYPGFDDDD